MTVKFEIGDFIEVNGVGYVIYKITTCALGLMEIDNPKNFLTLLFEKGQVKHETS